MIKLKYFNLFFIAISSIAIPLKAHWEIINIGFFNTLWLSK